MLVMADARIDALIAEDVPYIDLTTELLGIGKNQGRMTYVTREDCIVAGTDVNRRIAQRLGLSVEQAVCDGARARAGSALMVVSGRASSLHAMWKVGQNVYDHLSAVATKTRAMVDAAHAANPACEILTTRKSQPGAKDLLTLAGRSMAASIGRFRNGAHLRATQGVSRRIRRAACRAACDAREVRGEEDLRGSVAR